MSAHGTESGRGEGFTLIEVLLAVVIFAIVLAAINGVFYGAIRLRTKTARLMEQSFPIQQSMAFIKRDLDGLVAPAGLLSGALKSGGSAGGMGQSKLEIYTGTGLLDDSSPWPDLQKVVYALRNPGNRTAASGKDLVRLVTRNLLAPVQDEPAEQWLMSDVERLQFYFFDGTQWRDSWDSTAETSVLPKAIKVQVDLAANDTDRRVKMPFELVVPIVVQPRTNQTQLTGTL